MSDMAFYFACAMIILGGLGIVLGFLISAWEYTDELKYSSDSKMRPDQQGERLRR